MRRISLVVVDWKEEALNESGDLIAPIEKRSSNPLSGIRALELIMGKASRKNELSISLFKSVGTVLQDTAVLQKRTNQPQVKA